MTAMKIKPKHLEVYRKITQKLMKKEEENETYITFSNTVHGEEIIAMSWMEFYNSFSCNQIINFVRFNTFQLYEWPYEVLSSGFWREFY